jgi:predicted small secreted protein
MRGTPHIDARGLACDILARAVRRPSVGPDLECALTLKLESLDGYSRRPCCTPPGGSHVLTKAVAILLLTALAGCNTIAGAGKDIERGGQVIRDTAKDVQRKM